MQWNPYIVLLSVGVCPVVLGHLLPAMHRRTCFGVTVPDGFQASTAGQSAIRWFRAWNLVLGILGLAAAAFGIYTRLAPLFLAGLLLQPLGMIALFLIARSRVVPFAAPAASASIRVASLDTDPLLPTWNWLLLALPPLILAGAALYLDANWDRIPERFPVHWGMSGQPDRWGAKSVKGVYGILFIGASIIVMTYGMTAMSLLGGRRTAMVRALPVSMGGIMLAVAALFARIAVNPVAGSPDQMPLGIAILAMQPVLIFLGVYPMWKAYSKAEELDATPDDKWTWSTFYANPDDPAMIVTARMGMGMTFNLGHPAVRLLAPLLIGQLLLVGAFVVR